MTAGARALDLLVVAPFPLGTDRGSPIRARRLFAAARALGLDARVLAPTGSGPGVVACRLPVPAPARAGWAWQKPLFDAELAVRALVLARRRRPRVIEGHVHEGLAIALLARLAAPGATVVYNAHGTLVEELVAGGQVRAGGRRARLLRRAERWLQRRADVVVAQSAHRAAGLAADGVDPARIVCVPDAPEPELFELERAPRRRGPVTCVYTGSLSAYQGVDDILEAACSTPGLRYVLFGSPAGDYPRRAAALGLGGRVTFVDPAPLAHLPRVLAAADIALAPRHYGGNIPGKLPAYQAAGLPTVGTDVAGVVEILDAATGRVVPVGNVDALAGAIRELADDAGLRQLLGAEARARARRRYAPELVAEALGAAYGLSSPAGHAVGAAA